MKRSGALLMMVVAGVVLANQLVAGITPDNPYIEPITNRNLFRLKPPPDPNDPANLPPPPPLPTISLAGITTLLGKKLAVLRYPRAAKPPEPAKEVSAMLAEGESEEGLKVLEINVADGTVRIMNGTTTQTLDIKKNAPKPGAAPAPPPAAAPIPVPRPGGVAPAPGSGAPPPVTGVSRPVRGSGAAPAELASAGGVGSGTEMAAAQRIPSNEEQTIMWEILREKDRGNPDAPPYPPTELTPDADKDHDNQNMLPGMP